MIIRPYGHTQPHGYSHRGNQDSDCTGAARLLYWPQLRRGVGVAYRAALERLCRACPYREFESRPLRFRFGVKGTGITPTENVLESCLKVS